MKHLGNPANISLEDIERSPDTRHHHHRNSMTKRTKVMVIATAFTCGLLFELLFVHMDLLGLAQPGSTGRHRSVRESPYPEEQRYEGSDVEGIDTERPENLGFGLAKGGNNSPTQSPTPDMFTQAANVADTRAAAKLQIENHESTAVTDSSQQSIKNNEFELRNSLRSSFSGEEARPGAEWKSVANKLFRSKDLPNMSASKAQTKSKKGDDLSVSNEDSIANSNRDVSSVEFGGEVRDEGQEDGMTATPPELTSQKQSQITNGIYWSDYVEQLTPLGFTESDRSSWQRTALGNKIVAMSDGCGRMQNRLLVLESGSRVCARYRINTDQIQGDIYSYHLSRLLEIPYVPPSVLAKADPKDPHWSIVDRELVSAQWNPNKLVVLTPWLDHLNPAFIPAEFQEEDRELFPDSASLQRERTTTELAELVQWSDLIVFDYLTANLDRVVNNMFNKQWNSKMMQRPAHNLFADSRDGRLTFLDNESGLFHGYRLLDTYASYHQALLDSLCIFRKSTADNIQKLHRERNVGSELIQMVLQDEVYGSFLPKIPQNNINILQQRLADVNRRIVQCQQMYER